VQNETAECKKPASLVPTGLWRGDSRAPTDPGRPCCGTKTCARSVSIWITPLSSRTWTCSSSRYCRIRDLDYRMHRWDLRHQATAASTRTGGGGRVTTYPHLRCRCGDFPSSVATAADWAACSRAPAACDGASLRMVCRRCGKPQLNRARDDERLSDVVANYWRSKRSRPVAAARSSARSQERDPSQQFVAVVI